jgi:molecular chaperone DnaK (HSP70)
MSESTTTNLVTQLQTIQTASSFNRDQFDNLIKPSLFNLLSHRTEAAKALLQSNLSEDKFKELINYYEYCNLQISLLLAL